MQAIIESLRRDHHDMEGLLRVLEWECDLFRQAERPDYELLSEIIDYFQSFLNQYHHPKEDLIFNLVRLRNPICDRIIDDIADERAAAALSLQDLGDALRDILNEQRILREAFNDAARRFIQHERRQIEIEEQQLFPTASPVLAPADWADLHTKLRDQRTALRIHGLEERLRAQRRWIMREAQADQMERSATIRTPDK
jgi:hemerythrin-like domain-containing protein